MAGFKYDATVNGHLKNLLSPVRLARYEGVMAYDLQAALDLYVWNVGASSALYGPLQILEIVLRNALDAQLRALFGPNWPGDGAFRALSQRPVGHSRSKRPVLTRKIAEVEGRLRRARGHAFVPKTDDIVAGLNFGFWADLLHNSFEPQLWAPGLQHAFPNYSRVMGAGYTFSRAPVERRIGDLRALRNRIMHHEPLIGHANLADDYNRILETCAWIDLDVRDWIEHHARFISVLDLRERPRHTF